MIEGEIENVEWDKEFEELVPPIAPHLYPDVTPERAVRILTKYKDLTQVIDQLIVSQYVGARGQRLENSEAFIALRHMAHMEKKYEK